MDEHAWQRELEELTGMETRAREVLDVAPGASRQELGLAYRRVAKKCRPDLNPGEPGSQERAVTSGSGGTAASADMRIGRVRCEAAHDIGPDESGCCPDNDRGYCIRWRERFF